MMRTITLVCRRTKKGVLYEKRPKSKKKLMNAMKNEKVSELGISFIS
jgi:hypothetical protein